jgi:hypothetical protein
MHIVHAQITCLASTSMLGEKNYLEYTRVCVISLFRELFLIVITPNSDNDCEDTDCFIDTVNKFHSSRPNCASVTLNIGPNALPIILGQYIAVCTIFTFAAWNTLVNPSQLSFYTVGKLPVMFTCSYKGKSVTSSR